MFEDLEKNWAAEDKENNYVRDRIVRQLIGLAVIVVGIAAMFVWRYFHHQG